MDKQRQQQIIDTVKQAGQGHVLAYWDQLGEKEREELLRQLAGIDFDLLTELKRRFIATPGPSHATGKLEPAEFIPLPETSEEKQACQRARQIGESALREGRVAAFLVAGGQGSRLGFDGPKGKFAISPLRGKTLFQLHAEKILALGRKYGTTIPWYIMTSKTNHEETIGFFKANNFFGLGRDDVSFFEQEMIPALGTDGQLLLESTHKVFMNPNGHGGSLSALQRSGALDDMRQRGIDLIYYFQVDNVLINICDPVFLGYHLQKEAEMSAKIVAKTDPEEKVGVLARIDARLGVVEYSDLPDTEKRATNSDGTLKFRAGSIAIHVFSRDFVERETAGGLRLPWHVAYKKISCLNSAGDRVEPEKPNGFKFETFVFDALGDARKAMFLEVRRQDEFSPVKNADGRNSPETARRDMVRQFKRWLHEAGAFVPKSVVEISPLFALESADLKDKLVKIPPTDWDLYLG